MAQGIDFTERQVREVHDPDSRYGVEEMLPSEDKEDLDQEPYSERFNKIKEWFSQARHAHWDNREQQEIDADFYDGLQWKDEDIEILRARGQAPMVFNHVKPAVDWILGTERRTRVEGRVLPRSDDDVEDAQTKSKLLKYVNSVNKSEYARSRAFADAAKVGVGWLEDGISNDDTDEPLFSRYESWANIWYDWLSVEWDLSDARYVARVKWLDVDVAMAMFPERKEIIRQAAVTAGEGEDNDADPWNAANEEHVPEYGSGIGIVGETHDVQNRRERVRCVEMWYKEPASKVLMRGFDDSLDGLEYDETNAKHIEAVQEEVMSTHNALVWKMRCAVFTSAGLLQDMESPYRHNDFPFTPIWGFRRSRDNAPYGIIRNSRDPQEDMNKRMSKALFILSSNRIIADRGAVEDWNEALEEVARPDGVVKLKDSEKRFELPDDRAIAAEHLQVMDRDQMYIQQTSGITGENLGQDTNAESGKAIEAKQQQGSAVTYALFDNLRYAIQLQGEKQLSLIEQFYDRPKIVRITGEKGKTEHLRVNQPRYDKNSGEVVFENDITARKADFLVDAEEFNATNRQAMFTELMEMAGKLPAEITLQMLDLIVDLADVPNKDEIVSRIRQINGHIGPEDEADPEAKKRQQERQEREQLQQKVDLQTKLAELQENIANATNDRLEGVKSAHEVAQNLQENPALAPILDTLLKEAGYMDPESTLYSSVGGNPDDQSTQGGRMAAGQPTG